MDEIVTIVHGGHSKITTMHQFLTRYEKLGYVLQVETKTPRRRRAKTAEATEE
ncbi:MAG: hypothetical protein GY941_01225 [Planctomycetes bacterium]|nr:hypothetical protein [Planctomycetota bacterium]